MKFKPIINKILISWGIISLLGVFAIGIFIAYKVGPGNRSSNKLASSNDVRYVLNWCELGDEKIEKVVHSYISSRSLTGDHLDAHAIIIKDIDLSELKKNDYGGGWFRGDQLPETLSKGVEFVESWLPSEEIPWFLTKQEIRSPDVFVYPWSIYFHGIRVTAIKVIFIRPKDKMIFFFSGKV